MTLFIALLLLSHIGQLNPVTFIASLGVWAIRIIYYHEYK